MDEEEQRRHELAAALGLDPRKLLLANSGRSRWSKFELDTYLFGSHSLSTAEHGRSVGSRGKRFAVARQHEPSGGTKAGRPGPRLATPKNTREHAFALGAAGKFLLTPEQAETERLKSLHETGLLSAGPEETFDRIVAATRKFFNVGAASMSLITGDTQHFKSAVGPLRDQTPRQIALCTATVEQNSMLIINDTLTDDRFASNPLVVGEPHIRFYAGYPLHGPRGWNIGTLCIIDQKPRAFPASEQQVLRTLAALVQNHISSART
jgi:GAF domain-containing protein